jgi:hypothetical protein
VLWQLMRGEGVWSPISQQQENVCLYQFTVLPLIQRWARKFFVVSPQITNTQTLWLIPQSKVRKFLMFAIPQIANPQIGNDQSANRGVPVHKSQNRTFVRKKAVFLI